ncbi:hypothetical protein NT2_06_01860 [Caenibius tardaugens NBRC 16725]|uniref:Transglycosylase SLT domain-containing protein n=2 Tax=Caenibius TaxID=2827482 RepID=U2Y8Z3_9SPHN|nr:lytic transglycosylase [Caenibius tardaugens NBRC 16725]GAD49746.1 hypothetical protein NT2_06_01860 [Caenibius tardaugens NBRC 16725]
MICLSRVAIFLPRTDSLMLPVSACLALLVANPAQARGTGEGETRIAECIRQVAGGKPWLEKTLWGLRDQEAGWLGAEVGNTNGSQDLGPLQVNSGWVKRISALVGRPQADVRSWLVHDPCFNAGAARWIFLSALLITGDFWKAVGVYHSPTAWRQRRYALSVARHMQRRFGQDIFAVPAIPVSAGTGTAGATGASQPLSPVVRVHGFGSVQTPSS